MKVAIRADSSLEMGTGHVMRCLTLAKALRARGAQCTFICRDHPGNLSAMLAQHGFAIHVLSTEPSGPGFATCAGQSLPAHAGWLGVDWLTDARQSLVALGNALFDWLVVDHYALDARWENLLRPACRKLMVIDDLADRHHDCDLLLDQNLGREAVHYTPLVPRKCKVLAGPRYALLRPEFAEWRDYSLKRRQHAELKKILITMGGVDRDNATGAVLEALRQCALPPDCIITVVMGSHAPWLERVKDEASKMPWPTEVRVNVEDMAQLMADSDLAIGAAGSTAWERCCVGLPSVVIVLAENQRSGGLALAFAQACFLVDGIPDISTRISSDIARLTAEICLTNMIWAASNIADGLGMTRILKQMNVTND